MSEQYTPTLEEVKAAYRYDRTGKAIRLDDCSDPSIINADHSFDRMIAQVRQEAKVQALEDLADNHTTRIPDILGDRVQAVFTETIWEKLDELEENK